MQQIHKQFELNYEGILCNSVLQSLKLEFHKQFFASFPGDCIKLK